MEDNIRSINKYLVQELRERFREAFNNDNFKDYETFLVTKPYYNLFLKSNNFETLIQCLPKAIYKLITASELQFLKAEHKSSNWYEVYQLIPAANNCYICIIRDMNSLKIEQMAIKTNWMSAMNWLTDKGYFSGVNNRDNPRDDLFKQIDSVN